MNTLEVNCGKAEGWIKLAAIKVDENGREISRRDLTGWFPNLVTDIGLRTKAEAMWQPSICVGSGTSTPANTDADLAAFVRQTNASAEDIGNTTTLPYWGGTRFKSTFATGQATGNITEVGLCNATRGTADYRLLTRSLIKDTNGNPTAIEVLEDEQLEVTYDVRLYAPTSDVVSNVNIDGVARTITIRPSDVLPGRAWKGQGGGGVAVDPASTVYYGTCTLGTQLQLPSSTNGSTNVSQGIQTGTSAYVNNATYRDFFMKQPPGQARVIGGLHMAVSGLGCYQLKIEPPVEIEATESFKLTLRMTVGR